MKHQSRQNFNQRLKALTLIAAALGMLTGLIVPAVSYAAVSADLIGTDTTTGSTSQTDVGRKVRWVGGYNHTGSLGTLQFNTEIQSGQQYVPGSFTAPPDFEKLFSANGGNSYDSSDAGVGTTNLRAEGPAPGTSTARTSGIVSPPTTFNAGNTDGDGMQGIFFDNNVYNVNHHRGVGTTAFKMIQCFNKISGAVCPGFPTYASSTPGPLGQGIDDMVVPNQAWDGVYQEAERIYVPTGRVDTTEIGVLCIDLSTSPGSSCGFTKLGDSTNNSTSSPPGGTAEVSGGAQIGNEFYIIGNDSRVYCYDMAAEAVCTGWPALGLVSDPGAPTTGQGGNQVAASVLQAYDDRYVFGTHSLGGTNFSLICIDTTTDTLCPNFPVNIPAGNSKVAPILDATGDNVTGICIVNNTSSAASTWGCYDPTNASSLGAAPWQATQPAGQAGTFGYFSSVNIGPKLYLFFSPGNTTAAYSCWDFSINADCADFVRNTPSQASIPYSLREDPLLPGCLWMLGDAGIYEQIDAELGGDACARTRSAVTAQPSSFYCDGKTGHFTGWSSLSIHNLEGGTDYTDASITIRDADGNILPDYDDRELTPAEIAAGSVDLSGIAVTDNTQALSVELVVAGADSSAWQGNEPYAQLAWSGDAIQFCYETTVISCPASNSISNTISFFTTDDENPNGQTDTATASPTLSCGPLAKTGNDQQFLDSSVILATGLGVSGLMAYHAIRRIAGSRQ